MFTSKLTSRWTWASWQSACWDSACPSTCCATAATSSALETSATRTPRSTSRLPTAASPRPSSSPLKRLTGQSSYLEGRSGCRGRAVVLSRPREPPPPLQLHSDDTQTPRHSPKTAPVKYDSRPLWQPSHPLFIIHTVRHLQPSTHTQSYTISFFIYLFWLISVCHFFLNVLRCVFPSRVHFALPPARTGWKKKIVGITKQRATVRNQNKESLRRSYI